MTFWSTIGTKGVPHHVQKLASAALSWSHFSHLAITNLREPTRNVETQRIKPLWKQFVNPPKQKSLNLSTQASSYLSIHFSAARCQRLCQHHPCRRKRDHSHLEVNGFVCYCCSSFLHSLRQRRVSVSHLVQLEVRTLKHLQHANLSDQLGSFRANNVRPNDLT